MATSHLFFSGITAVVAKTQQGGELLASGYLKTPDRHLSGVLFYFQNPNSFFAFAPRIAVKTSSDTS